MALTELLRVLQFEVEESDEMSKKGKGKERERPLFNSESNARAVHCTVLARWPVLSRAPVDGG